MADCRWRRAHLGRRLHAGAAALGMAAVCLVVAAVPTTAQAAAPYAADVTAPREVAVGDVVRLKVHARGAPVGASQVSVSFDHRLVHVNGAKLRDNGVAARGRTVQALGPVRRGRTETFGFFSYAGRRAPDAKRRVELGTLELLAVRRGTLRVRLVGLKVAGTSGGVGASSRTSRTLDIRIRPEGARHGRGRTKESLTLRPAHAPDARVLDVTGDAIVDGADAAELGAAWTRAREDGVACTRGVARRYDITDNGCLDVADIQLTAARSALALQSRRARPRAAAAATFVVNSKADSADAAADGECRTADGKCTLRAAITEANRQAGSNAITFQIKGRGVHTIQLTSALPTLSDLSGPTTIDGYTQRGAAVTTDPVKVDAKLKIQIAGNGYTDSGIDAIVITSPGNVVRGVAIYNTRRAIRLYGDSADSNVIAGNFIGTDASATAAATSYNIYGNGVSLEAGASSNRVGGAARADANVISGNSRHGVGTYGEATSHNVFHNNIIGLSPDGTRRLQNFKHGIDVNSGSAYNIIGGTSAGERNVISGNGFENLEDFTAAVEISHSSATVGNAVVGNYIGTDLTGTSAPDHAWNSHYGIRVEDLVNDTTIRHNVIGNNRRGAIKVDAPGTTNIRISDNRIGVSASGQPIPNGWFGILIAWRATRVTVGPGNVIAYNPVGVQIGHPDSDFNTITRNSIYGNTGLGIDLEPWGGVNPNDAGDLDTGTNQQLNFPVIGSATTSAITGTACAGCTVEALLADGPAGAHGEGRTYLGKAIADGNGAFAVAVSGIASTQVVTTTATDADGNTSEFSQNVAVP